MAFASPTKKTKNNTPDKELIIKVNTSKGFVTLGRIGLYNESALHTAVAALNPEQLTKLLASASLEVTVYSRNDEDKIELVL